MAERKSARERAKERSDKWHAARGVKTVADARARARTRGMTDAASGVGGKAKGRPAMASTKPTALDKAKAHYVRKKAPKAAPKASTGGGGGTPRPRPKPASVKAATPKPAASGRPRSIAAAKKAGSKYFWDKNGTKKLAVTAEDLKKSGLSLRDYANKMLGKTRRKSK